MVRKLFGTLRDSSVHFYCKVSNRHGGNKTMGAHIAFHALLSSLHFDSIWSNLCKIHSILCCAVATSNATLGSSFKTMADSAGLSASSHIVKMLNLLGNGPASE
jgi:hypothetical protein